MALGVINTSIVKRLLKMYILLFTWRAFPLHSANILTRESTPREHMQHMCMSGMEMNRGRGVFLLNP